MVRLSGRNGQKGFGEVLVNYKALEKDLAEARMAAIMSAAGNADDGGTCNFDTPVIIVKYAKAKLLGKAAIRAGVRISKWSSGVYHIYGDFLWGQANLRTRMAETFTECLRQKGYEAYVFYAMD